MKILLFLFGALLLAAGGAWFFSKSARPREAKSGKSIYDYSFTSIEGKIVSLAEFKGKKILIVNVASQCGFTPQYADLEQLYLQEKNKLEIIGFPANDFMGQEPGTNEEIVVFCKTRYGVTFPLSQKISVVGDAKSDLFKWLTDKQLNGWNTAPPKWNFYKYLLDEQGELIKVFPSTTGPMSADILNALR